MRRSQGSALSKAPRPATQEAALTRLLRGFPTTVGIAGAFLVVFVTVPVLRVMSLLRRRVELQIPLVTDKDHYGIVANQVAHVLTLHGFSVHRATPGWWMTLPSRVLLQLGGPAFRDHIPEHLAFFQGERLEVALYPNGLLLRGSAQDTAWAHGLLAEALASAPALQTFDPRAQDLERQIRRVWSVYRENTAAHEGSARLVARLDDIAAELGQAPITYEEWQIVYRQTLQLGRALHGDPPLLAKTSPEQPRSPEKEQHMKSVGFDVATRQLSNRALISEITGKASLLARKEIELAKAEIRADFGAQLGMVKALSIAAIAALLGLNLLFVAGVLALALTIPGWLAALLVGGALIVVGAIAGYVGYRRMVTKPLAVTRQTLKEDVRWVKERLA
jgi:hypothetical protein